LFTSDTPLAACRLSLPLVYTRPAAGTKLAVITAPVGIVGLHPDNVGVENPEHFIAAPFA
jgi:hypothetical protein